MQFRYQKIVLIVLNLLMVNICFSQVNLNLGLKAYYPFSGNANDASGNNNHAIFNNASLTADRQGNPNSAYHFNGVDNYIQVANSSSLNFSNQMSIALKVRPTGFYTGLCYNNMMVMKGNTDYLPGNYFIRFSDVINGCTSNPSTTGEQFYSNNCVAPTPIVQLNEWYDVVWTSDGVNCKLYVNCELKITAPQTDFNYSSLADLFIGRMNNSQYPYWLNGDLDEIRIYDRPLNFDEVKVYSGCNVAPSISNIINEYTPVIALNPCNNSITVEDASAFNTGDTVLMIQMKGASVDSSNSASFGDIQQINNAGNYEYNYVKAITGNIIELKNKLTRQYDLPGGKVQLVRVPYYNSVNITGTLTCLPWNGIIGGVLALNVRDTINLNGYINVTGMGFRGALGTNTNQALLNCNEDNYYYASIDGDSAALKGESIAELSDERIFGRGKLASAGGGGNSHNSGGGGGANGGSGGLGGYQVTVCTAPPFDNRGIGGNALTYNNGLNKIFMGGGGGAGHVNNPQGFTGDGGNGGGIAIITGNTLVSASGFIISNGNNGTPCTLGGSGCHEGMGGGGAGGTILLNIENYINNVTVNAIGGNGGVMTDAINGLLGPGGGGGGGTIWFKPAAVPSEVLPQLNGGINGTCINQGNNDWGATSGSDGINVFNLNIPVDTALFVPNIDSVKINESAVSCNEFNFNGLGYTNTSPINNWQWNFGDSGTASTQNASHLYTNPGVYNVKLIITDANGCKDSIVKSITVSCTAAGDTIINVYTPVLAYLPCDNSLTVENSGGYQVGDTVLIIQMKGAIIDSTNTSLFGDIIDYKNSGNYEYNYIRQITGNNISLKNKLTRQYDIPTGKVQLVRAPYYSNSISFSQKLTCLPWDGSKGGILAFNVRDTLSLSNDIDVSGKGFRGANIVNPRNNALACNESNYFYSNNPIFAGPKGEGIAEVSNSKANGKGPLANGGGGGNGHNSGAGGGSNSSTAGKGGKEWISCTGNLDHGGFGGKPLVYSTTANKVFMGGGGGAGHCDNIPGFNPNGGNGGGIVLIKSGYLKTNNNNILANGDNAVECTRNAQQYRCHEGMGGGGGGGTLLLDISNYLDNTNLFVKGGKGADMNGEIQGELGPGGGGGGGVTWLSSASAIPNITISNQGGLNGVAIDFGNTSNASTPGQPGNNYFNLSIPIDTVLFKPNIDSVRFNETALSCNEFNFNGIGYTNTTPITNWQWNFGDNNTAFTQNTTHTYASSGTYTVTLLVTDINGCKDSIVKNVTTTAVLVNAGNDTSYCSNTPVTHVLQGTTNGSGFSWTPAAVLNNPAILNPTATISSTTTFYLTATSSTASCTSIDSVTITVNPLPAVATIADANICRGDSIQLNAFSTATTFSWSPPLSVNNSGIQNPYFTDTTSQVMVVTGTNTSTGCTNSDNVLINVNPSPVIRTRADTSLCGPMNITLNTIGGQAYSWSPATNLNNPTIASPVFNGTAIQTYNYIVTGSGPNGCTAKDTVTITINAVPVVNTIAPVSICRGDSILLTTNSNAQTHQWSPPLSVNNSGMQNPYFTDTVSQVMIITGTNSSGCFVKDTVNITVKPKPNVQSIADVNTCATQTVTLTTSGAQTYNWTPVTNLSNASIESPVFNGVGNYTYYVTGTAANGCTDKDTVNILIGNKPVFNAPANATICATSSVQLNGNNGNAYQYNWSPGIYLSNAGIENPLANPPFTTTYMLQVYDPVCNYDSLFNVVVNVNQLPLVNAIKSNDIDCARPTSKLLASGANQYEWSPSDGLNNPLIYNPVASPQNTTTYIVTGTDQNGCVNKDTLLLNVKGQNYFGFNIPNSFTPNGDNLNDCFGVPFWGDVEFFALTIFNRWGEKVFETYNKFDCWNGTYKSTPAPTGNYVFILTGKTQCGIVNKKGNLLLLR